MRPPARRSGKPAAGEVGERERSEPGRQPQAGAGERGAQGEVGARWRSTPSGAAGAGRTARPTSNAKADRPADPQARQNGPSARRGAGRGSGPAGDGNRLPARRRGGVSRRQSVRSSRSQSDAQTRRQMPTWSSKSNEIT